MRQEPSAENAIPDNCGGLTAPDASCAKALSKLAHVTIRVAIQTTTSSSLRVNHISVFQSKIRRKRVNWLWMTDTGIHNAAPDAAVSLPDPAHPPTHCRRGACTAGLSRC